MPRVVPEDVQALRPGTTNPLPFIITAHFMVNRFLVPLTYSEGELWDAERWWAAHLCELADPRIIEQKLGDTSQKWQTLKVGEGLSATWYGQQLKMLIPEIADVIAATSLKKATFDVF